MNKDQAVHELNYTFECCSPDDFPNLPIENPEAVLKAGVKVLKPNTHVYNCWAYALHIFTRWVELDHYSVNDVDAMFLITSKYGFVHVPEMDFDFDPSVRKIVFYAKNGEVTHAALRIKDGWRSKLGYGCLIFHPTLEMIAGDLYGEPAHMFQRRR